KLIGREFFGLRIEPNHVVGDKLGVPDDVVLIDRNRVRLAARVWRVPFAEVPGLRIEPRKLARGVLRDPEDTLRIGPEPARARVGGRRMVFRDLPGLGIDPTDAVGSGAEFAKPGVAASVGNDAVRTRVRDREVPLFQLAVFEAQPADSVADLFGEPEMAEAV